MVAKKILISQPKWQVTVGKQRKQQERQREKNAPKKNRKADRRQTVCQTDCIKRKKTHLWADSISKKHLGNELHSANIKEKKSSVVYAKPCCQSSTLYVTFDSWRWHCQQQTWLSMCLHRLYVWSYKTGVCLHCQRATCGWMQESFFFWKWTQCLPDCCLITKTYCLNILWWTYFCCKLQWDKVDAYWEKCSLAKNNKKKASSNRKWFRTFIKTIVKKNISIVTLPSNCSDLVITRRVTKIYARERITRKSGWALCTEQFTV